jgi:nucleotide-binding universal stress UspA family protein
MQGSEDPAQGAPEEKSGATTRGQDGERVMTATTLVVGLDGSPASDRALNFAKQQATAMNICTIVVCYVVEWSPYTFQTPEENEERHARREHEIKQAHERVIDPVVKAMCTEGFNAEDHVAHGDVAEVLDRIARERGASHIIIGRVGTKGLIERVFGGVSGRLVATATVPVTIVP